MLVYARHFQHVLKLLLQNRFAQYFVCTILKAQYAINSDAPYPLVVALVVTICAIVTEMNI